MRVFKLIALTLALMGTFALAFYAQGSPIIQNALLGGGYLGVFLFSVINGFNIFVPIVTASFVPALTAAGLNPYILIATIALGMTIADSCAFLLARAGRVHLAKLDGRVMRTMFAARERRHWLPLVVLAFWVMAMPLPNEVALIPLGLIGYASRQVIPIVLVGNLIFNSIITFWSFSILSLLGA